MAATLGIPQIAELMRRYLEEDAAKKSLVVEGKTVEEAVADAALQLGVSVKRIEFEVVEKGSPGMMGAGRKKLADPCLYRGRKEKSGASCRSRRRGRWARRAQPSSSPRIGTAIALSGFRRMEPCSR